jgi:mono/diheme cytochrome c family protein
MRTVSLPKLTGLVFACLVFMTVASVAMAQTQPAAKAGDGKAMKNPVKSSPQSIEAGHAVYQKSCAHCHGAAGKGDGTVAAQMPTKPSNLADEKWENGSTDGEIFLSIRDGVAPKMAMKPFKGKITDQDIWNIVNYIRSIGPKLKTK